MVYQSKTHCNPFKRWWILFKLERSNLKDQATELLREHITSGRIPPGSKLVEREVADSLGISRAPARDALMQLEKEGLVVSRRDARYVIQVNERDIRELYQLRLVLEKLAVRLAAENTSPSNRAALLAIVEGMEQAYLNKDNSTFTQSDVELHTLIWQQANNRHLNKTLDSMIGPIFMFVANNAEHYDWQETLDLHRELVDCINSGDADAASASMERHLANAFERSLHIVQQRHTESMK